MTVRVANGLNQILDSCKEGVDANKIHLLNFWTSWAEPCIQMNEIVSVLSDTHDQLVCWDVDAEVVSSAALNYQIEAVPTFVFLKNGTEVSRVNGAKPDELVKMTESLLSSSEGKPPVEMNEYLRSLIYRHSFMIFIKGTPEAPRCGFTRQLLELLSIHKIQFDYFDILSDENVRQSLKAYSNWPTYPQIYINGELLGGIDIFREMLADGSLSSIITN